ncbi:hypothetical protein B0J17DRAFT_631667 [Rhizoctonia solani]|nr:hypothetical protein B0J17DRAFT_631667 [Rhizoctonia solani]
MCSTILVTNLSCAASVLAHGYVQQLKIGGEYVQAWSPYKHIVMTYLTKWFLFVLRGRLGEDSGQGIPFPPVPLSSGFDTYSCFFYSLTTCHFGNSEDEAWLVILGTGFDKTPHVPISGELTERVRATLETKEEPAWWSMKGFAYPPPQSWINYCRRIQPDNPEQFMLLQGARNLGIRPSERR